MGCDYCKIDTPQTYDKCEKLQAFAEKHHKERTSPCGQIKHKHFKPFQKVLVSCYFVNVQKHIWCADLYSHFDKNSNKHCVVGNGGFSDDEILPYEGNEDKLGKLIK